MKFSSIAARLEGRYRLHVARRAGGADVRGHRLLQLLSLRAGREPTRAENSGYGRDFRLGYRGAMEGDVRWSHEVTVPQEGGAALAFEGGQA